MPPFLFSYIRAESILEIKKMLNIRTDPKYLATRNSESMSAKFRKELEKLAIKNPSFCSNLVDEAIYNFKLFLRHARYKTPDIETYINLYRKTHVYFWVNYFLEPLLEKINKDMLKIIISYSGSFPHEEISRMHRYILKLKLKYRDISNIPKEAFEHIGINYGYFFKKLYVNFEFEKIGKIFVTKYWNSLPPKTKKRIKWDDPYLDLASKLIYFRNFFGIIWSKGTILWSFSLNNYAKKIGLNSWEDLFYFTPNELLNKDASKDKLLKRLSSDYRLELKRKRIRVRWLP